MEHVLALIGPPGKAEIGEKRAETARRALDALGAETGTVDWLSEEEACEIPFTWLTADQAEAAARSALGDAPLDILAIPVENRKKRLLFADMDSTVTRGESLDILAKHSGLKPARVKRFHELTRCSVQGEMTFLDCLAQRIALLEGIGEGAFERTLAKLKLTGGARALVRTMRKNGADTFLVSGSLKPFVEWARKSAGFQEARWNRASVRGGKLTGKLAPPLLGTETKLEILREEAGKRHIPFADILAVGDGANDIPMVQAAGMGIAFRPRPPLAQAARLKVVHGDLTALLYAQGYRRDEFVS